MEDYLKFYFLAEESGWDCTSYAFAYRNRLLSSGTYQVVSINVMSAKKHLGEKAQQICETFASLDKDAKTLKDVFILENTLNYLALNSFPEYYLNPLAINPRYSGDVTTIGDLIFDIQGQEKSLNEWIVDQSVPLETKKEEISDQLDYYLNDMNRLVTKSMSIIKNRAFSTGDNKKQTIKKTVEGIFFVLLHIALFTILLYPFEEFQACLYVLDPGKVMTYIWFLFPLSVFFFDIAFMLFHSYKARISEPYNYARRFLKKNVSKVYEDIKDRRDELYAYICGALNNHLLLKNDITDFSKLSSSYVDIEKVISVDELQEKKTYQFFHFLLFLFGTLAYMMAAFTIIIYVIGMVFRTSI